MESAWKGIQVLCVVGSLLLSQTSTIMSARWPIAGEVDDVLLKEAAYLTEISHDFRVRIKKMVELRAKVG